MAVIEGFGPSHQQEAEHLPVRGYKALALTIPHASTPTDKSPLPAPIFTSPVIHRQRRRCGELDCGVVYERIEFAPQRTVHSHHYHEEEVGGIYTLSSQTSQAALRIWIINYGWIAEVELLGKRDYDPITKHNRSVGVFVHGIHAYCVGPCCTTGIERPTPITRGVLVAETQPSGITNLLPTCENDALGLPSVNRGGGGPIMRFKNTPDGIKFSSF